MQFTDEQQAFISECVNGEGSIILNAVAGSGKTSTLVEAVNSTAAQNSMLTVLAVAFNKKIADELSVRMDPSVVCKTMNALGHAAWGKRANIRLEVNSKKTWAGFRALFGHDFEPREEMEDIYKLAQLAKANNIVPDREMDDYATWEEIVDHYDLMIEPEFMSRAVDMCRQFLRWSIEQAKSGLIDFDDQLYMPINFGGIWRQFDMVLVDEAQDISGIQRLILAKSLKPDGRLIAVGDPHQAIYGFRGAAHDSMELIAAQFHCQPMGLTYSFRCPQAVVKEAKRYVKEIQSAPGAKPGMVVHLTKWSASDINPKAAIICRNTRPLIDIAFRLIRRGIQCYVLGRDIGVGLQSLVKRMQAGDILTLVDRLEQFKDDQRQKYSRLNRPERLEAVYDKVATLMALIDHLPVDATMKDLSKLISDLFSGITTGVCLATLHKAKGLEWPIVYFLDADLLPSKYATQGWQLQQEDNLAYVAITRAIDTLIFVSSKELE